MKNKKRHSEIENDPGYMLFTQSEHTWQIGSNNFWIRTRGLIGTVIFTITTMGSMPWWSQYIAEKLNLNDPFFSTLELFLYLFMMLIFISVIIFVIERGRAIRSMEIKRLLHRMSHDMRDSLNETIRRVSDLGLHYTHERLHMKESSNLIAQSIFEYYKALSKIDDLFVAIRLEGVDPRGESGRGYYTVGRKGRFTDTRADTSEPIPADKGVAKIFRSPKIKGAGVAFYYDLNVAIRAESYFKTQNDEKYCLDGKYVISVPINGWVGEEKGLIGILTIASPWKKVFKPHHLDLLRAISDRLGEHYTAIFYCLKMNVSTVKSSNTENSNTQIEENINSNQETVCPQSTGI